MRHGSLFSGIGGFDLAADWMGWTNEFHCEWNPFGRKLLNHYWPEAKSYEDITKTDFSIWRGKIDILTGGFPCQPYSAAGKRKGKEDDRHLWPEMLRAIREIQPTWVVGENVLGITNWNGGVVFEEVCAELENEGYEVQPFVLPAAGVGAPHKRDRVWFIAHARNESRWSTEGRKGKRERKLLQREQERCEIRGKGSGHSGKRYATDTDNKRLQGRQNKGSVKEFGKDGKKQLARLIQSDWEEFPTQPPICIRYDGFPSRLDGITFPKWRNESIKAAGNAIVPKVVYQIFKSIIEYVSI